MCLRVLNFVHKFHKLRPFKWCELPGWLTYQNGGIMWTTPTQCILIFSRIKKLKSRRMQRTTEIREYPHVTYSLLILVIVDPMPIREIQYGMQYAYSCLHSRALHWREATPRCTDQNNLNKSNPCEHRICAYLRVQEQSAEMTSQCK